MSKASLQDDVLGTTRDSESLLDDSQLIQKALRDVLRAQHEFEKRKAAAKKAEEDDYAARVNDAEARACEAALKDRAMQVLGEAGLWHEMGERAENLYAEIELPEFGSSNAKSRILDAMFDVVRARIADAAF